MRPAFLIACLCLAALAPGCGGTGNSATPSNTANAAPDASTTSAEARTVTIDSPDGVKLVGSLWETDKPNSPALLMLHQWESDRHSFDEFARKMQAKGFEVLAIDGRGFGESIKKADGSTVKAGRTDEDVKAMLGDVDAAFDYLSKQANIDPRRVGIVGASYGSSLAIIYAADHPSVAAVALLSPGIDYFGNMPTKPAVQKYDGRPLFLVAADDDKESADAVKELDISTDTGTKHDQKIFSAGGHGTALLKAGAADELRDFFLANLSSGK